MTMELSSKTIIWFKNLCHDLDEAKFEKGHKNISKIYYKVHFYSIGGEASNK